MKTDEKIGLFPIFRYICIENNYFIVLPKKKHL